MSDKAHSMTIGIERLGADVFLSISAVGKLTHEDYELMTPLIEGALSQVKHPKVRVLIDATKWDGWELRAAWDDFKLGIKYYSEFDKIAMYGKPGWQENAAKVANWFVSGEMKYFERRDQALAWLLQDD